MKTKGKQNRDLPAIERLITRFLARVRLQRATLGAVEGACLGLMLAAVGLAASRTGFLEGDYWWIWALSTLFLTLGGALFRAIKTIDPIEAAQAIDRANNLHDRLSTAVALAREPDYGGDPEFARAQLEDALRFVGSADPRRAAPWKTPADTRLLALIVVVVISIGLFPLPNHERPLPPPFKPTYGAILDDATLAMERDRLRDLRRQLEALPDELTAELLDQIEALLDAVENREISEREFLDAIERLIEEYFESNPFEGEITTLEDVLAEAAQRLQDSHSDALSEFEELEEIMRALEDQDFQRASEAMKVLAERLNEEDLSADQAQRLADLLEAFSDEIDAHDQRLKELFEEHRDTFEDLARQFEGRDALTQQEEDLLNDARERMEEAGRQQEEFQESMANRQLEELSRELDETAEELRREDSPGGQSQDEEDRRGSNEREEDQGDGEARRQDGVEGQTEDGEIREGESAEQGPRQGGEQGQDDRPDYRNESSRRLDDASRQLDEMEQQRQQQEQRQQARRQLEELRESMARSQPQNQEGEAGEDRRGQQMEDFMDRARGESDREGEERQTQRGDDSGRAEGEDGEDGEFETGPGDGPGRGGPDDGTEPGSEEGRATAEEQIEYQESILEVEDFGAGRSRSEIIRAASEEGFSMVDYSDVYAEYHDIAEEVMERESVPDGYRYYIKRYFQLIRPQQ